MANTPGGGKRQIGAELIIPVMALLFTLYYFSTIIHSPWTAQVNAFMVGSILIVVVLAFFVLAARELLAGRATLAASQLLEPYGFLAKRGGFLLLTWGYLFTMRWVGFTLGTFLFLIGAMLLLGGGRRVGLALLLSTIMSGMASGFFVYLFDKRLPRGPIEHLVDAVSGPIDQFIGALF